MSDLLDRPAAIRTGEELDLAKLEPYLRAHFPDAAGELQVRQFPSGHSNLTYSLHLGTTELVLRRPPFGSKVKSAHDMSREFRVLSKLHAAYPPAPRALLYCDDAGIIGAPFYVMVPIRGIILRRTLPAGLDFSAEKARKLSESFVDNLIRLHRVDYAASGPRRSRQAGGLSRAPGARLDRTLLRLENPRLPGSRKDFFVDAAAHAAHHRRLARPQ